MIPFASQRGNGQDLATHLMNAQENERIEVYQVRRAVARDLHGAFAEWEAIAHGLNRARQYLCSLSVNPDERQGRLTREQYLDYIDRAEAALGLTGQPRAIIFHEKHGDDGAVREHCHVIWSRTDVKNRRAIPLSFFKEKLMAVTRAFADDHGLRLPPGYEREPDEQRRNRQLSAYDCVKQQETGISHEERMAAITDAWQRSDSAEAFVAALEDLGYVLARGRNKTRIVLVDFYGHTTALTRLIDDASVPARHVRDFLGAVYAPDDLPSVEEAQDQAAQRRQAIEDSENAHIEREQAAELASQQAARRDEVETQAAELRRRQHDERVQVAAQQKAERQALKSSYRAAQRRIRLDRARHRPQGLAAFLGRVSGITLIIRAMQRHRDRVRYAAYLAVRNAIKRRQRAEREALAGRHGLQAADIQRRLRALDQIEQRERESLAQMARKERRQRINERHVHMPPVAVAAAPAVQATARSAMHHVPESALARELAEAAALLKRGRPKIDLAGTFAQASGGEESDEGTAGDSDDLHPEDAKKAAAPMRPRLPARRKSAAGSGANAGAILTGNLTAFRARRTPAAAVRIQAVPTRQKMTARPGRAGGPGGISSRSTAPEFPETPPKAYFGP